MSWHEIPPAYLKNKAHIQLLNIAGKSFCLSYHQGQWVAFSAKCPHAGASLAGGWCEQGQVVCPFHRHSFDLKTGRGSIGQHNYITIYTLRFEEDKCSIFFKSSFWSRLFN